MTPAHKLFEIANDLQIGPQMIPGLKRIELHKVRNGVDTLEKSMDGYIFSIILARWGKG